MTMTAQPPAPMNTLESPLKPFYTTPNRKRRAISPSLTDPPNVPSTFPPLTQADHRDKRRRPNLANGFQGLSISTDISNSNSNTIPESFNTISQEDEGIGLTRSAGISDLKVEILPDKAATTNHHHHSTKHHWSVPNHAGPSSSSSTSPTTSSEENYDSDVNFAHPSRRYRRYAGVAQQADEIVQPDQWQSPTFERDLAVEDITVNSPINGRRRREDEDEDVGPTGKRLRQNDMEIDMEGEPTMQSRRRGKSSWHEPEKDRIVITSLSDTSSSRGSSRSSSPEANQTEDKHLSQPGMQGFTLSPSLLTHLLKSQRDQLHKSIRSGHNQHSLVLYRPLGIPPGEWNESVVKAWHPDEQYVDSGRFEEIDDDENFAQHDSAAYQEDVPMDVDGDVDMD